MMGKKYLSAKATITLIEGLRTVRQRYPFSLYAYALMPNHFHLLLEVHRFPTARILQSLLTGYAQRFNKVHRRRGHLFEGRYKAIVCDRDSHWNWSGTFISIQSELHWSSGLAGGSGVATVNTWESKSVN